MVELCYFPHHFTLLSPTFQLVSTVFHFFQLPNLVSDCHSVYQRPREHKIFDFFVARVVQKLYSGNSPFHIYILCSFLWAIRRYIDCPEWSRRNKMFSAGVSTELHYAHEIRIALLNNRKYINPLFSAFRE